MKIVHLVPGSLIHGGVGVLVLQLCRSLADRGHSVTIYALNRELKTERQILKGSGLNVKLVKPVVGDPLFVPPCSLMHDIAREEVDVVHAHNLNTLFPGYVVLSKKRSNAVWILQPHYHPRGQSALRNLLFSAYKIYLQSALQDYDGLVANSEYERQALETDFPRIIDKVILVPEEHSLVLPKLKKMRLPQPSRKILYVGALTKYKKVDIIIRAVSIISSSKPDLELVIVGSGPEKGKLVKLAQELDLSKQVIFREDLAQEELWQEYLSAKVLVILSSLESFSRVAHEAMKCGTPLVVNNRGPLREFVRKGYAYGIDTLDPHEVAQVINNVIERGTRRLEPIWTLDSETYVTEVLELYETLRRSHD